MDQLGPSRRGRRDGEANAFEVLADDEANELLPKMAFSSPVDLHQETVAQETLNTSAHSGPISRQAT
jgi:hypothetical protein